jgi:histidine triad (HIT) family protein
MPTIFTKIINGEIPSHKILEDENHLAFLDIRPIHAGHTLVVPKKEIDYLFDMDDASYSALMLFSKKVGQLLKRSVSCKKIGVVVCGIEVSHVHVHLIPIDSVADVNFANAKPANDQDLKKTAEKIRNHST